MLTGGPNVGEARGAFEKNMPDIRIETIGILTQQSIFGVLI